MLSVLTGFSALALNSATDSAAKLYDQMASDAATRSAAAVWASPAHALPLTATDKTGVNGVVYTAQETADVNGILTSTAAADTCTISDTGSQYDVVFFDVAAPGATGLTLAACTPASYTYSFEVQIPPIGTLPVACSPTYRCIAGTGNTKLTNILGRSLGASTTTVTATSTAFAAAAAPTSTVYAWGDGNLGSLGQGAFSTSPTPVYVSGMTNVVQIGDGAALKSDGSVWAWGYNAHGGLGQNNTTNEDVPFEVLKGADSSCATYLCNITSIAGSPANGSVLAVDTSGHVWTWGYGTNGILGNNNNVDQWTPVEVVNGADAACATYLCNIRSVNNNGVSNMALDYNGHVWAWGYNAEGELGNNTFTGSWTPVEVLKGADVACPTAYLCNITQLGGASYNNDTNMALDSTGYVWSWGENTDGEVGNNTTANAKVPVEVLKGGDAACAGLYLCNVTQLPTQGYTGSAYAVTSDGHLYAWGENRFGQLGIGNNTGPSTCGANKCALTPVEVLKGADSACATYLCNVVAVSMGDDHAVAATSDGTVYTWGSNANGQLGINNYSDSYSAVKVFGVGGSGTLSAGSLISGGGQESFAVARQAGGNWTQLSPASAPTSRHGASTVYDDATGNLVLFGGGNSGTDTNETWTWDGTTWTQKFPATSPPKRHQSQMVYDAATGNVVLYGGWEAPVLGDTWTWDGTTWTQKFPATSPPTLEFADMVYDPATRNVLLFGGTDGTSNYNQTWTWDGVTWTKLTPATSPSARQYVMMAYDATNQNVVLFGGDTGVRVNETWTWDGVTWTQKAPATSPSARGRGTMIYDTAMGTVVLFGGSTVGFGATDVNDTWTWDGTTWAQLSPVTSPSARWAHSFVWDPATGYGLMFGGSASGSAVGDTWTWGAAAASGGGGGASVVG